MPITFSIKNRTSGFTLVEVLIVVTLVGVLTAVALFVYSDAGDKAKRREALGTLSHLATMQERYYVNNGEYAAELSDWLSTIDTQFYAYTVERAEDSIDQSVGYVLTAEANFLAEGSECATLMLDSIGRKTPLSCWR